MYFVLDTYINIHYTFAGKETLGITLGLLLIMGSLIFIDGFSRWKERYEEKREYEREQHKIKLEAIKNQKQL